MGYLISIFGFISLSWFIGSIVVYSSIANTSKKLVKENEDLKAANSKIFHQKKSSEVRVGNIAESLAPLLDNFPCSVDDAHFFGRPIDYIAFEDDGVHFIEVKSGGAQLSPKQRRIRDHILNGKVHWHVMRIK